MRWTLTLFSLCVLCVITLANAREPHFQHIIIIVQENRTPDNLFQGLCSPPFGSASSCTSGLEYDRDDTHQYDIQTRDWLDKTSPSGTTQPQPVHLANLYDLRHTHSAFVAMCNASQPPQDDADRGSNVCQMNGAAGIPCTAVSGKCPAQPQFKFVDNSNGVVNPYLQLATQYGWANHMFQTNQGPSFPAHQFLFGGTSAPTAPDDAKGIFASENTGFNLAGCAAPAGSTVALIDPSGQENQTIYPCFEHLTIPDLFSRQITWRYYSPVVGSIWTAPNAIQHLCESTGQGGTCAGDEFTKNVDTTRADVLNDIANCNLRSVSWVIPTELNSDHAGVNDGGGPSWVAAIVNAIGNSSACDGNAGYWKNTAIVITWDDWGGWYDHVAPSILPGPQGDYQYGFRVPLLVVSAYTPRAYINNTRLDFGSILKFVEDNFQVGSLHFADQRAEHGLDAFFDLDRQPRAFQTIAAAKDAKFFLSDTRPQAGPDED